MLRSPLIAYALGLMSIKALRLRSVYASYSMNAYLLHLMIISPMHTMSLYALDHEPLSTRFYSLDAMSLDALTSMSVDTTYAMAMNNIDLMSIINPGSKAVTLGVTNALTLICGGNQADSGRLLRQEAGHQFGKRNFNLGALQKDLHSPSTWSAFRVNYLPIP